MIKFAPHRYPILASSSVGLLATLLLSLPLRLQAGEVKTYSNLPRHPLTLRDCIAIAFGESPKLEATRLDLLAAGAEIRAAQDLLWPNLKGAATGEMFSGDRTGKFGIVNAGITTGGGISTRSRVNLAGIGFFDLRLDYPVFKDGSIFGFNDAPTVEIKKAQRDALAWTAHLTREDVIFRITQVFVDTVSVQNRVEPVHRRVELFQQALDIHKEQQQKGLGLPIDVEVATKQLNSAQSLSKALHEQVVAGHLGVTKLLGLQSSAHITLDSTLPEPPA